MSISRSITAPGGGGLVQEVEINAAAIAPALSADAGWLFTGWDVPFDNITAPLTVIALYDVDLDSLQPDQSVTTSENHVPFSPSATGVTLEVGGLTIKDGANFGLGANETLVLNNGPSPTSHEATHESVPRDRLEQRIRQLIRSGPMRPRTISQYVISPTPIVSKAARDLAFSRLDQWSASPLPIHFPAPRPPMKSIFSTSRLTLVIRCVAACGLLAPLQGASSFVAGASDNGQWAISNTSSDPVYIANVSIVLAGTTFFDTDAAAPGTASTGWGYDGSLTSGGIVANFPTDASTDGTQAASFDVTGFNPTLHLHFVADIDVYENPDSSGNPAGATISVLFRNISDDSFAGFVQQSFTADSITINGQGYSFSAVPEPSTLLLGSVGVMMLLRRRRGA